jgi:hypothetical protein
MQCGGFQRGMQVFERFHETYGKLVRLPSFNPSENQLMAFDPEDFKTVFQADGTNPIGAAEFAFPFKQWFHSRGDHNFAFARVEFLLFLLSFLSSFLFLSYPCLSFLAFFLRLTQLFSFGLDLPSSYLFLG